MKNSLFDMHSKRTLILFYVTAISFVIALLTLSSCKKSHSEIGKIVFKETKNKVFKEVETEAFIAKFKAVLKQQKGTLKNPKFVTALYEQNDYEPVLLAKNLPKGKLKQALMVLSQSQLHGLDPSLFNVEELNDLLAKTYDKDAITKVDEAYECLAKLELGLANSLTNYSNTLQYGLVSPKKIYAQYYTETARPDSASFLKVFETADIKLFLDSIQPKSKPYKTFQKALQSGVTLSNLSQNESKKVFEVALERARWQNKPNDEKYVLVNVADYRLDVIDNRKSVLSMKVCVGEGRKDGASQLRDYDENTKAGDRPFNRETPQLNSLIHSVQVNPIWNIPESIANNEIVKYASADKYYLGNKGIDVYLDGKKVEDPETIDWKDGDGSKYQFKQRPGDDNSLGKIKFLFDNQSSVYLHDTPAKEAFKLQNRAVSHGCVRVEKPLDLAKALFGAGAKFNDIKTQMQSTTPEAKDIMLPNKIPVYLAYQTCWVDDTGTIQYRKDIYGLDAVLYAYLQKMI